MGRGEYYRNKYGNGGRGGRGRGDGSTDSARGTSPSGPRYGSGNGGGRGRGRGGGGGGWRGNRSDSTAAPPTATAHALTWQQLGNILQDIHNRSYNAYHDLERVFAFVGDNGMRFRLAFDHIQGDPYASPSRAHVQVETAAAGFTPEMYATPIRNVALCDYLTRTFAASAKSAGADAKTGASALRLMRSSSAYRRQRADTIATGSIALGVYTQ